MVEKTVIQEDKIEKILCAAQKRFARFGLSKTTMHEIAEDLGTSKAALYYYFQDKESIFKQVVLREQDDYCNRMKQLAVSDKNIKDTLENFVELRREYFHKLINLGKLTYDSFREAKPLYAELGKRLTENEKNIIKTLLENALKHNEIRKVDTEEYAGFFVHVLRSLRLCALERKELWEQGNIDLKLKQEHILFTEIFLKSILLK